MSETDKRPGVRDISDLKARLGLKKPGAARPQTTAGVPAPAGVVPPPGLRGGGGVIPAPPGAAPPPGLAGLAPIPDATQDPFGAMNALAAQGARTAVAAPQIVVVNDGNVENVGKKSATARWGKLAAVALVPLGMGVAIGQISSSAKLYNRTIDDAAAIRTDLTRLGKGLVGLQNVLLTAKERGGGGEGGGFKLNDKQLLQDLESLEMPAPDIQVVFSSMVYELEDSLVQGVLSFYTDLDQLYSDVKAHVARSKADAKTLDQSIEGMKQLTPFRYAAYVDAPAAAGGEAAKNSLPMAHLVELGAPLCADGKPNPQGCGGPPKGFLYRPDSTGPWGPKELAQAGGEVAEKKLVLLNTTAVLESFLKGAAGSVAEIDYRKRLRDIDARVEDLVERRKNLENRLNSHANSGKRFTFFL